MREKLVILGGYGNTGIKIAHLMLKHTDAEITLAARNSEKLSLSRLHLSQKYPGKNVSTVYADASDRRSLLKAFEGSTMVVVASGTAQYASTVARAALEAGIDYLDVQYSTQKLEALYSLEKEIEENRRCFITDGGFHPGLPAAIVRYGALRFDRLQTAIVGSVIRQDWENLEIAPSTEREFVQELVDTQTLFFKDGAWKKGSMWSTRDFIKMDFSGPPGQEERFGGRTCVPMFFEELRPLPEVYPSLKHLGFYIAGFNWFVDFLVFPLVLFVLKLFPHKGIDPMARLMGWSLSVTSKPPFGIVLKLEATGEKDGESASLEVSLYHEDGYWFTAIPVAACLLQYLDGSINKPGLWTMGNLLEPVRLMKDMEKMGIRKWEMRDG